MRILLGLQCSSGFERIYIPLGFQSFIFFGVEDFTIFIFDLISLEQILGNPLPNIVQCDLQISERSLCSDLACSW